MKNFSRPAPISFTYADETFSLPGEMPMAATLFLYDIKKNPSEEVDADDVRGLYYALLGEDNAKRLIDDLGCGVATLQEIVAWYATEVKQPSPKAVAVRATRVPRT